MVVNDSLHVYVCMYVISGIASTKQHPSLSPFRLWLKVLDVGNFIPDQRDTTVMQVEMT